MNPLIILLGFVIGMLIGLSGMGGGAVLTPALMLLGVPPIRAVGSDLLYMSITRGVGSSLYMKSRKVEFKIVAPLLMGTIPSIVISALILRTIMQSTIVNLVIRYLLSSILILTSTLHIIRLYRGNDKKERLYHAQEYNWVFFVFVGFLIGVVVVFTSVGSGTILALVLLRFMKKGGKIVGTDMVYSFVVTSLAAIIHAIIGNVDIFLVLTLLMGSIPGVTMGFFINHKIPDRYILYTLSALLFMMGIILLL